DDGQWLDTSSADVIVAAFNDLFLDRVGLLVTVRSGDDRSFDGLEHLAIGGLSEAACSVVFADLHVEPTVLASCWSTCGGNPLALDVLLRRLDDSERQGIRALPEPLPVADAI